MNLLPANKMKDGTSADSFVGSLISLTSKSEIRYEGILHSVDADNANISLQNVRMFGTEGRKMDGPQILASGKVYDYIIFRGSDIKDLQVKSAAASQKAGSQPPYPHNDPAIISLQSHRSQEASVSPQFVPPAEVPITSLRSPYNGLQPSTFQNNLPLMYQPPVGLGTWGVAPSENANGARMDLPSMYWHGYYRTPGSHSQLQQQPLPSQILLNIPPIPPAREQKQPAAALPFSLGLLLPASLDTSQINKSSITTVSCPLSASTPTTSEVVSNASLPLSLDVSSALTLSSCTTPSSVNISPSTGPEGDSEWINRQFDFAQQKTQTIRSGTAAASVDSATQVTTTDRDTQAAHLFHTSMEKPNVEIEVSYSTNDRTTRHFSERKYEQYQKSSKALLPFPTATVPMKQTDQGTGAAGNSTFGWQGQGRQQGRGRGRWRARGKGQVSISRGHSQIRQEFFEDFDFATMNEKFKKEEVWGELGNIDKAADSVPADRIPRDSGSEMSPSKASVNLSRNVKPIYVKDDFFDNLSCDALDRKGGRVERIKYSEQWKVDSETFGSLSFRSRGRGGRRHGSFKHSYPFDYGIHRGGNHSSEREDKNEYNGRAFVPSSSARSRQLEGYK